MKKTITTAFLLLSLGASGAAAQQFKIEDLGVLLGAPERAIDMNEKGLILAEGRIDNDEGGTKKCPFLFDPHSKSVTKLCDQGLVEAYDLNNKGDVAGACLDSSSSERRACVWRAGHGAKRLGLVNDSDTYSVALGLNDRGIVVGYSGYSVEQDDGYGGTETVNYYTALSYSLKKKKLKDPFKLGQRNTVAFKVSNRGLILGGIDSGRSYGQSYNSLVFPVIKRTPGQARVRHASYIGYIYGNDLPETINKALALNERKQIALNFRRLDLVTGAETDTIVNNHQRDDYGSSAAINSAGNVAGWANSKGYLYTDRRLDNSINCLFPQNQHVFNDPTLTIKDLSATDLVALDDQNRMLLTADLVGDGQPEHLFIVSQLPVVEAEQYFGFCPTIFVEDVSSPEGCGGNSDVPEGTICEAKVSLVDSNHEPVGGLRFEIQSDDPTGPGAEACTTNVLSNPILGIDGTRTINFTKDGRRYLNVVGPTDERFAPSSAEIPDYSINEEGYYSSPYDDTVGVCFNND